MRNPFTTTLLIICASAAVAGAGPDQKPTDRNSDDVHVTVTAGRGRLGVAVIQISPELRAYFGAPNDRGVLVDSVRADNPAARAGVHVGDVLVEVDGTAVQSATDVLDALGDRKKGDHVPIVVVRSGKRVSLTATLDDNPGPRWQGFRDGFDKAFPKNFDWRFDMPQMHDENMQKQLDDARKRIEELERRIDKMQRT